MDFYKQLGAGVASLTFGVALSIFIYAVASGIVSSVQSWLLFGTSFLLMLRFWWRYSELFVQFLPSRTYWHFLFDFATAFFAILAVLFVNNLQTWALLGMLAMISSAVRCFLSWTSGKAKAELRRTLYGAACMLIILGVVYYLVALVSHITLSAAVFIIVLLFVVYTSWKK